MRLDWYKLADRTARAVIDALPGAIRERLAEVAITLDSVPPPDERAEDGDDSDLLGLFTGPSLAEETGVADPMPAAIHLYVENIRDEAGDVPARFREEVRTTLLHEIGHYLGLDEDALEQRGLG